MGRKYYENHIKVKNMNFDYLEEIPFIKFQRNLYKDKRILSFYKQQVSTYEFNKLMGIKNKTWKQGFFGVVKQIFNSIFVIPVKRKPVKGIVLKELTAGFSSKNMTDDYFVDEKIVKSEDVVYHKSDKKSSRRKKAYSEAEKKGLKTVKTDRLVNLNKVFLYHLFYNFFGGIICFFKCLFHSRHYLPMLDNFLGHSNFYFRLFSFVNVELFMGDDDRSGVVPTIVGNKFGIRTFLYPWSDLAVYENCGKQDIGYNDLFIWGESVLDAMYSRNTCDNIYIIGSRFANSYDKKPKDELREKIGFPIDKKIVTFYGTTFNKYRTYSPEVEKDLIEAIKEFAKNNPDLYIVYRAKNSISDEYRKILEKVNVKIHTRMNFFISDIICASDVNIGTGINTTITISLLCGIPGLNYDITMNDCHPFSKNEEVTFHNKKDLFIQIDKILKINKMPSVPELNKVSALDVDTLKVLRKYIKNREVNDKYRYK